MSFVPDSFSVPTTLVTETFRLHPLTIHDVVRDYDAVMTSQPELWERFGTLWSWPKPDLSFEQDLIDLAWHQKEAQRRQAFTYAVLNPQGTQQVGCVYVDPSSTAKYDASVLYWVRTSELSSGMEAVLGEALRHWFQTEWPFRQIEYPGRTE
ncbi:hypothetical protein PN498_24675 [Oscillatoria sp. CS-180]|uniref:GNAT family N-acetyltransferase n=1 Tax=Oscillatoria sp. CS-180 TaxID=3021720 RepID=UPI00232B6795|nr:GNAT family N-acetyltransferase [Oscillatoria sp. CS-180]MDB9529210.1 hypothetical protein [Oscillatoria sp. CS-180]